MQLKKKVTSSTMIWLTTKLPGKGIREGDCTRSPWGLGIIRSLNEIAMIILSVLTDFNSCLTNI